MTEVPSAAAKADEAPGRSRPERGRRRLSTAFVFVGGLLTFLAIFSIWVNRQALNTDNWVSTSAELLQNEEVKGRLSEYLSEQLFANVDVREELAKALPQRLAPLAAPAAAGLQQAAPQIIERVIGAPRFQAAWETANRAAHEALLRILDGGGTAVSTEGGEVTLRLGPALESVGERVGIGALAGKLPAGAGELTILRSEQLSLAQEATKLVRRLPIVLTLLAALCFAAALWLARSRRRLSLRAVGFAFLAAGLLALLLRHFAGPYVVGALAQTKAGEPAVEAVWSIGTSLLVTVAVSALAFGLLLIAGAALAGPTRTARAARRLAAPYAGERPTFYATAALLFVLLVLWAPIAALSKPLGVLAFGLLFAAGTELWRRQALAEFPHQPKPQPRLPGWWRHDEARGGPSAPPADELERLAALHDRGDLDDSEFARAKLTVLGHDGR